jgi:hypothetical protein
MITAEGARGVAQPPWPRYARSKPDSVSAKRFLYALLPSAVEWAELFAAVARAVTLRANFLSRLLGLPCR